MIGFDILCAEPDRLPDAELKSRLAALPDNDAQLAEASARAGSSSGKLEHRVIRPPLAFLSAGYAGCHHRRQSPSRPSSGTDYQLLDIYASRIATLKRHSSLEACNGVSSDTFLGQQGFLKLIRIGLQLSHEWRGHGWSQS